MSLHVSMVYSVSFWQGGEGGGGGKVAFWECEGQCVCGNIYFSNPKGGKSPLNVTWCIMCIHAPPPPPPPPLQVAGEDEGVSEKAIEYVSTSLISMRHILFIPHPEIEKHLLSHVKEVSCDGLSLLVSLVLHVQ